MINHVGTHVYQVHNRLPVDHAPELFRPLLYRIANAGPDQLIEIEDEVKKILGEDNKALEHVVHSPKATIMNPTAEMLSP